MVYIVVGAICGTFGLLIGGIVSGFIGAVIGYIASQKHEINVEIYPMIPAYPGDDDDEDGEWYPTEPHDPEMAKWGTGRN